MQSSEFRAVHARLRQQGRVHHGRVPRLAGLPLAVAAAGAAAGAAGATARATLAAEPAEPARRGVSSAAERAAAVRTLVQRRLELPSRGVQRLHGADPARKDGCKRRHSIWIDG